MDQDVLDFIETFQSDSNLKLFSEVACYWFALILKERFKYSSIYYNPHIVHFATEIGDTLYDISGAIDDEEDEYYEFETYISEAPQQEIDMIKTYCIRLRR